MQKGFTLLETIIYIGLFGIMFTGVIVSTYPLFTSAERLTRNIAIEGESAFILSKIRYALANTITSPDGEISTPSEGTTADELILEDATGERFQFAEDSSNTFCTPPLTCKMLTLSVDENTPLPLNAGRVGIENFSVTHVAPTAGAPRYVDVSFDANGEHIGPVRYYQHF